MDNKRNLAVIPARSGSKGIKDKNIRLLNNKPLMAYTIEAAKKSNIFQCIHVSTDSTKYAEIARQYGAEVPFLRSRELASDTAGTWDTVRFVLEQYANEDRYFDTVTVLQPTSPLRTGQDICNAYKLFCDRKADSVISVCEAEHSPLWCNILPEDGCMNHFLPDQAGTEYVLSFKWSNLYGKCKCFVTAWRIVWRKGLCVCHGAKTFNRY